MASRRIVSAIRSVPVRGAHAPAVAASAAPSAETLALRAKEAGSWKSLSVEEKRQIYRATYGQSRAEIQEASKSHDNTKVFAGVAIAVASGLLLSKFFNSLANPAPKTLSPEWKAAQAKKLKEMGTNPVFGISSK